jgi:hypothetical protein
MSPQGRTGVQVAIWGGASKTMDAMLNHEQHLEELEAFPSLEEFSSCAGKLYWVALVLTGDDKKAREIFSQQWMTWRTYIHSSENGCANGRYALWSRPAHAIMLKH